MCLWWFEGYKAPGLVYPIIPFAGLGAEAWEGGGTVLCFVRR